MKIVAEEVTRLLSVCESLIDEPRYLVCYETLAESDQIDVAVPDWQFPSWEGPGVGLP